MKRLVSRYVYSNYLNGAFDATSAHVIIQNTVKYIREQKLQFSTIAYTGHSGALVAPTVAYLLRKNLVIVRKDNDDSHSGRIVEGYMKKGMKFIIIDDFISTGRSIGKVIKMVKSNVPESDCVGVVLWKGGSQSAHKMKLSEGEVTCHHVLKNADYKYV